MKPAAATNTSKITGIDTRAESKNQVCLHLSPLDYVI